MSGIDKGTRRLARLVHAMLDVSRIQAGTLVTSLAPCDLATVVHDAVAEQRLQQPKRDIRLTLPADSVPVLADADRLGQVITNYLTNALKYAPEDQPIEVALHLDGSAARVAVRDAGPGLPPEEQQRVWDPFHRVPGIEVQSGSAVGLGLGLGICRTIIQAHPGGQVGVESAVGHGSTFWFTLPLLAHDARTPPKPADSSGGAALPDRRSSPRPLPRIPRAAIRLAAPAARKAASVMRRRLQRPPQRGAPSTPVNPPDDTAP